MIKNKVQINAKNIIIIVLVIINFSFVCKYINLKNNSTTKENCEYLNPSKHKYINLKCTSKYINKDKMNVLCVLNQNICFPCVVEEIKQLKKLKETNLANVKVFFDGDKLQKLQKEFPSLGIERFDENFIKFNVYTNFYKHATLLIDEEGFVLEVFRSESDILNKTKIFYNKLNKYLTRMRR